MHDSNYYYLTSSLTSFWKSPLTTAYRRGLVHLLVNVLMRECHGNVYRIVGRARRYEPALRRKDQ